METKIFTIFYFSVASLFTFSTLFSCAQKETSVKSDFMAETTTDSQQLETATFANGCFWCTEAIFQQLEGVVKVTSGYSGGHVANPTYEQVCEKKTGHAEALNIVYDKSNSQPLEWSSLVYNEFLIRMEKKYGKMIREDFIWQTSESDRKSTV